MKTSANIKIFFFALIVSVGMVAAMTTKASADDPMRLVMNGTWQTAVHHYYVGQDVPGYQWDIYFRGLLQRRMADEKSS